jgi:hypothetical protein
VLSDFLAEYFIDIVTMPIFKDPAANHPTWEMMDPGSLKHDTFVYDANGVRTLVWKGNGALDPTRWRSEIAAAVRALPP